MNQSRPGKRRAAIGALEFRGSFLCGQDAVRILGYSFNVAFHEIGLETILLLVAEQWPAAFGAYNAHGLEVFKFPAGHGKQPRRGGTCRRRAQEGPSDRRWRQLRQHDH